MTSTTTMTETPTPDAPARPLTGPELLEQAFAILREEPTAEELEADPSLEEAWTERLIAWADATGSKMGAYRAVWRAATAKQNALKAAVAEYATAAKRQAGVIERMDWLATGLLHAEEDLTGAAEAVLPDGSVIKLKRRKSSAVQVVDIDAVHRAYIVHSAPRVDKAAAARVLRAGHAIPGLELEHRTSERVHWGP